MGGYIWGDGSYIYLSHRGGVSNFTRDLSGNLTLVSSSFNPGDPTCTSGQDGSCLPTICNGGGTDGVYHFAAGYSDGLFSYFVTPPYGWVNVTDDTYWNGFQGTWTGFEWEGPGPGQISLSALGPWVEAYKPTRMRITYSGCDPTNLILYNNAFGVIISESGGVSPSETVYTIEVTGAFDIFLLQLGPCVGLKIQKIEFFLLEPYPPLIKSLYQFSKGERSEIYTLAQYDSGCVKQATNNPPEVTTGIFGNGVFIPGSDTSNLVPASWVSLRDILIYSDGMHQHKLFPGLNNKVGGFVVVTQTPPLPRIPEFGKDHTDKILENNNDFPTFNMGPGSFVLGNAFYVMTPVPANTLSWVFNAAASGSTPVGGLHMRYVNTAGDFVEVTNFVDGTYNGSVTMSQDGDMTWDKPTDESATFMFGQSGYWYKFDFLGETSTFLINSTPRQVLYSGEWRSMENVWDGILIDVIEAQLKKDATSTFETYGASAINIDGMVAGIPYFSGGDELYLSCADFSYGLYINVGETPNTNASTLTIDVWTGDAWTPIAIEDGTVGLTKSGFITWSKVNTAERSQFNSSQFHAFWYRLKVVAANVSDNVVISAQYLPVFSLNEEFGEFGICNSAWKERACYTSSIFDRDIYVSASGRPNVLNGSDFAILEPGDGRRNRTVCIKKFHNEIIVWQEEKGRDGGCTTLFEGYNPSTFGKLVLSSQVGTFSAKSAVVIDGATTVTKKDDNFQTMAYWISHYGIFMTDGRIVTLVSNEIQNHFDTDFPDDCIRLGYEDEMWVEHDQDRGVLRFGLVTGPDAEYPNTFPIFDLEDGTWSFDTYANDRHGLTHALQIEAESGQYPIIHIGAALDGFVYLLNAGLNDNGDAIDYHMQIELNNKGFMLDLREANLRMRVQPAGSLEKEIYENSRLIAIETESLPMTAEQVGDGLVRHRVFERIYEETHISIGLRENTVDQDVYLYDLNMDIGSVLNK